MERKVVGEVGWVLHELLMSSITPVSSTTHWCAATLNESHDFAEVWKCYNTTCPRNKPSTHPSISTSTKLASHFLVVIPPAAIVALIFPTRSLHGQITTSAQYFNSPGSTLPAAPEEWPLTIQLGRKEGRL